MTWVEAAITLGRDPTAHVRCPTCGHAEIVVRDVFPEPRGRDFERYLECPACKARNVLRMKLPPRDGLVVRMGNPVEGPWGEDRIEVTVNGEISYDCHRGDFRAHVTASLTAMGMANLAEVLRAWPFADPPPLAGLPPGSTFVELSVTRGEVELTRRVAYHAARTLPGYDALLALLDRWFAALRPPVAKRRNIPDEIDAIVDS